MSKRAKSRLKTTGPAIKPIGPKNPNPPKMESKIINGWICIPFFIKIGDSKLSDNPIRATPQTAKPMAPAYELAIKRYKIAGIITIDEPTTGIKEAKAATTPQRIGLGMPKIANPKAVRNPFARALKYPAKSTEKSGEKFFILPSIKLVATLKKSSPPVCQNVILL